MGSTSSKWWGPFPVVRKQVFAGLLSGLLKWNPRRFLIVRGHPQGCVDTYLVDKSFRESSEFDSMFLQIEAIFRFTYLITKNPQKGERKCKTVFGVVPLPFASALGSCFTGVR